MNADQLEIKVAQGAKPGEGGQLPGAKVNPYIASIRACKVRGRTTEAISITHCFLGQGGRLWQCQCGLYKLSNLGRRWKVWRGF